MTVFCTADLVRKYSDASSDIVSHLASSVDVVTSSEGRAAIVWMLGEFGHVSQQSSWLGLYLDVKIILCF